MEAATPTIQCMYLLHVNIDSINFIKYYAILKQPDDNKSMIKSAYPRYVHARVKGHVLEIDSFKYSDNFNYYVDVRMALRNASDQMWWDVYDDNKDDYRPPCTYNPFNKFFNFVLFYFDFTIYHISQNSLSRVSGHIKKKSISRRDSQII